MVVGMSCVFGYCTIHYLFISVHLVDDDDDDDDDDGGEVKGYK